jgi:hypothetical protein
MASHLASEVSAMAPRTHLFWPVFALCFVTSSVFADDKTQELKLEAGATTRVDGKLIGDDRAVDGRRYKRYHVRLEQGKTYRIDLVSTVQLFDPYLIIKDESGSVLAEDDDGGGGLNARLEYLVKKTATYQIVATTFMKDKTGEYTLSIGEKGVVVASPEIKLKDGQAEVKTQLADGDPMELGKVAKVFTCSFTPGKTYRIRLESTEFDSYLTLLGPDGKKLAEDDDGAGDINAQVVWNATKSGHYRILAATLDGRVGNFRLHISETATKVAKTMPPIELKLAKGRASVGGQLAADDAVIGGKPYKAYRIQLEAGKSYRIDLVSDAFDAFLYLQNKDGDKLAEDDDSGGDVNARITYDVSEAAEFRVLACSLQSNGRGNYTLSITEVAKNDAPPR